MTAVNNAMAFKLADAPSHGDVNWHAIDWHKAHQTVRRLQARIVKATQEGNWWKVRSLQRLLTHSYSGRVLAVRRVTENHGKRTAGVDEELWDTPQKKTQGVKRLEEQKRYKAYPLKRRYIPKENGRRPLGIPCMIDRAHQALHLLALDPTAETTGDPNSYGFRKERSPADAIQRCFNILGRPGSAQWILKVDVTACFDKFDHDWMLKHIPTDKKHLREWLKAGYLEENVFHETEEGSPQGGVISPVLANLVLDGLERLLAEHFSSHWRHNQKVHLVRFADDFAITGCSRELLEEAVKPLAETFLAARGLSLSPHKTKIVHIDEGFDFLGQNIRKYKGKLLITPMAKSEKKLLTKVRLIIKNEGKNLSAYGLIRRLNPVIRGWANYHRHVVSQKSFNRVDYRIQRAIWQWAKRRHRDKSSAWLWQKYFAGAEPHRSIFHSRVANEDGQKETLTLYLAARTPIQRHVKVKAAANPYDPAWEMYFEERHLKKAKAVLWDKRTQYNMLRMQQSACPVCGEPLTEETCWHNHHIVWRVYGGGDELANRVLLHPNCHQQVHSSDYTGPALRPARGV
jgi:RNA-directed DNA polymerase